MEPPQPTQEQAADSIVLEEEIDPNYVPSEAEVLEYVKWLGMDLESDRDLFWIAREGLMAPLPANWKPCKLKGTDDIYYFNFSTGESTWDHPCDEYYKRLYEEEKKKKEIALKENNDQKRAQAKQDIQTLIGKKEKKPKKTKPEKLELKQEISLAPVLDRKPLPGLKLSNPLGSIEKREDTIPEPRNIIVNKGIDEMSANSRMGSLPPSESKLNPLGKLPLESKQSKEISDLSSRSMETKPVDERSHPSPFSSVELDNRRESKPTEDLHDSPDSDIGRRKNDGDGLGATQKSQRNFLTFRGLDEGSQQKAIAANLRVSNEKKDEIPAFSSPKEDLRPLLTQLEQENAKLLSKLAFNEIELKNCKNELDMMTLTIDKHRGVADELNRVKSELLAREEELFAVRGKLRTAEYEVGLLQDQLKSKDLDTQRVKLKFEEEIDNFRVKLKSAEVQYNSTKDALENKECELCNLKATIKNTPTSTALLEQEISTLRNELSSKSMQLQHSISEMQGLQTSSHVHLCQKDEMIASLKASQAEEVEQLKHQILELQQKVAQQSVNITPELQADHSIADSLRATISQLEKKNKDLQDHVNTMISSKDLKISELNSMIDKLKLELDLNSKERDRNSAEFQRSSQIFKASAQETDEKLATAEENIKKLKDLLSNKTLECSELSNEISLLSSKSSLLAEKDSEIISLKTTVDGLRKLNQQLKDSSDGKQRDIQRIESTVTSLQSQILSDKENYQETIRSNEITIKHLQDQVALLSDQNREKCEQNLKTAQTTDEGLMPAQYEENIRSERYKSQVMGLEIEKLKQLLELRDNALSHMAKKDDELLSAMNRLRSVEFELATNMKTLQDKENEMMRLQHEEEESKLEILKMKAEVMRLNEICNTKEREISKMRADLSDASIGAALHSANINANNNLVSTQAEEIKTLKESLRASRSENEKQQHEILLIRTDMSKLANELDTDKSKLRRAEIEIQHLQEIIESNKTSERVQSDARDTENMKLRSRIREIEHKLDECGKQNDVINEELHRLKQDNFDLTQQLSSEREVSQQKDKKIRSFREELLQLQKRMSEKELHSMSSPVKPTVVFISTASQTDPGSEVHALDAKKPSISTSSKGVQCSATMVSKETSAHARPFLFDIAVQTDMKRSQSDAAMQTGAVSNEWNEDVKFKNNSAFEDIRLELDQRRAESLSLFELIKNYESKLSYLIEEQRKSIQDPQIRMGRESVESPVIRRRSKEFIPNKCLPDGDEDPDVELATENIFIGKNAQHEYDSDQTSNSDELKSLSELRTKFANTVNNKVQFTPDKILEAMSSMFTSLQSSIYQLKVHGMKSARAMARFQQRRISNVSASTTQFNDIMKILVARSDSESELLKALSQWLIIGKSLIKDSKVEIERLKTSWKKSSSSSIGSSKSNHFQRNDLNLDRDNINSLTADLNFMIRLVRMIQESLQSRSKLVKSLMSLRKKIDSSGKQISPVSLNLVDKMNEKFSLLEKDLDGLHENMEEMMKPILSSGGGISDISDLEEEPMIQISSKGRIQPSAVDHGSMLLSQNNVGFSEIPNVVHPRYQNFVRSSSNDLENVHPPVDPYHHQLHYPKQPYLAVPMPSTVSNFQANPHLQLVAHTSASLQSYQHRLTDIQKQLSAVQTKQVDSLKECDKHVSWLSGLIKEIDVNIIPTKSNETTTSYPSMKTLGNFDQFIL